MIKFVIIDDQTGESQEKNLTPDALSQGGGLIGRHPGCDIVLESPDVSRVHGRIIHKQGQYYFTDLGSTGGSQVNKEEALTNENFLLKPNDIIRIGGFILLVKQVEENRVKAEKENGTIPVRQPQPVSHSQSVHQLQSVRQPQNEPIRGSILDADPARVRQLVFKAEELKDLGILNPSSSEFVYEGKLLVKGLSLSKRFRQKVMEFFQSELEAGKFCLLVEHTDHITIWQEKLEEGQGNSTQSIPVG